jgi:phenylpropionate dioxygenase-like ring-hydroxylating dioxygenase large terminal subunit
MIDQIHWHPVAQSVTVMGDKPLAARLLGHDLVLWRDAAGQAHAWADRCPHRGTKLSLGRVIEIEGTSRLECPYHGWQFERQGQCTFVPSLPDFTPPSSHRACRYETHEAYGLVWVRMVTSDSAVPPFEAEFDAKLRKFMCGPYDVNTSAARVLENFLDVSHFGLVHEGSLGDREHLEVERYKVETTSIGFTASGVRAWQPRSNKLAAVGTMVDYRYELIGPFCAVLTKLPAAQDGYKDVIGIFVCPMEPDRCRVWFRVALTDFGSDVNELRAFQDAIFKQDQPILESQTPRLLPVNDSDEVHVATDASSSAYRRYLRERGITFGVC